MSIPRRIVRTVPTQTSEQVEAWWRQTQTLHPGWEFVTHREPVDPQQWPLTGHLFDSCESGAARADLIRLEDLWWRGGIYLDSDVEVLKPLNPLLTVETLWAAFEDERHVCNAVFGSPAAHPALEACVKAAIQRHHDGTWQAGVGAFTDTLKHRDDVLLLPPQTFYAVHYRNKAHIGRHKPQPWEFAIHHWAHSWATV